MRATPNAGSPKVLVCEPDTPSLDFMMRALEQAGLPVAAVAEPTDEETLAQALDRTPGIGLVIVDAAVVERLGDRFPGRRGDLQWIILGNRPELSGAMQRLAGDTTDFLMKPVARGVLMRATQEAMRRYHAIAEQRHEQRVLQEVALRLPPHESPSAPKQEVRAELRLLQLLDDLDAARMEAFPKVIETDPTWNMLNELLRAKLLGHRISVTSLCLSSRTPVTTALRRLERLVELEYAQPGLDAKDRRRKYIELAPKGQAQMMALLQRVARELSALDPPPRTTLRARLTQGSTDSGPAPEGA